MARIAFAVLFTLIASASAHAELAWYWSLGGFGDSGPIYPTPAGACMGGAQRYMANARLAGGQYRFQVVATNEFGDDVNAQCNVVILKRQFGFWITNVVASFVVSRTGEWCPVAVAPVDGNGYCCPKCCRTEVNGSNPISGAFGNKYQNEVDYVGTGPAPLVLGRHYNSLGQPSGPLGANWRHEYQRSVVVTAVDPNSDPVSPTVVKVYRHDGSRYDFVANGSAWVSQADVAERLERLSDPDLGTTGWLYHTRNDDTETYDDYGRLTAITTRAGATIIVAYDANWRLATVKDSFGRTLTFSYDTSDRIRSVSDPAGRSIGYGYDASNNLATVTYPDVGGGTRTRTYLYGEAANVGVSMPNALTGIIDENGARFATYRYDSTRSAVSSEHAFGADRTAFAYSSATQTQVTDALGTTRIFAYATVLGNKQIVGVSQPCPSCGGANVATLTYDANGNVSSRTDFNGNKVCYAYDLSRNLETMRIEGIRSSEICATVLASPPNRPDVRAVSTTWHATFRMPASMTEPAPGGTRTTTYTYDASGNLIQKAIVAPANDGTAGTITRTWHWTYGTLGRVQSATDPDNHPPVTYSYYPDNDADPGRRGNLRAITNPAGHVTQFTAYDADGRPLATADPNGLVSQMTYDPRGRLLTRQVGIEVTAYAYDGVGQLVRVTLSDNSYLQYTYDAAHRLIQLGDGLGDKIVYTLDAMGNRIREDVYDPANALKRTRARTFDTLNRLSAELGAQQQATRYTYDSNGNLLTVKDPLNPATVNAYDALNRVVQVRDPATSLTQYVYDQAGNLTQVTDSRGNATSYAYDGLTDATRQASPDTGITTSTYDGAGNLQTRTDARGVTASYGYDALNRVTQIVFSRSGTPSETHSFAYDLGANAKGRLAQVTDPAGVTTWTYNGQGRVAGKAQQVGGVTRAVSYGYNAAGQLTSITTPSGQVLGYSYLNNRVSAIMVNGAPLVTGIVSAPFGAVSAWQWSNGLFSFRDYDLDGRIATWEFRNGVSVLRKDQSFDPAGRIVGIADPNNPAASQTYQYDMLDRLTVAQSGNPVVHTQQFNYDSLGNRQNVTTDGVVTNLTYAAGSNQLQQMTGGVSATYLNGATTLAFNYNNANRLVAVQSGGVPLASYAVNALGQRVRKTVGAAVTYFMYDEQGHLLGEYDGTGALIEETVWLEDLPVATLRPTGAGSPPPVAVYYVHADHLGSPRAITRPSDNAMLWHWDNVDPFGANVADENPGGQGTFKYALRFPGQYHDTETGTHQNYFRDYDSTIGRYEQSDPIGLRGGVNTYSYVGQSPIRWFDFLGLQTVSMCNRFWHPHTFLCVDGVCGGKYPSGTALWSGVLSPGQIVDDTSNKPTAICSSVPNGPCDPAVFARCVDERIRRIGPTGDQYNYLTTNCGQWAEDVITQCRAECVRR